METFQDFQTAVFDMYQKRQYAEAYETVDREMGKHPEHLQGVYYWKLCLAAIQNQVDTAIGVLREALDHGYWYSARALHSDSDLAILQGNPTYETLVTKAEARRLELQKDIKPSLTVIEPKTGSAPYPLLMALHGNNNNAADSVEFWQAAAEQGWLVALPSSSQLGGTRESARVWDDQDVAAQEIAAHYAELTQSHSIDSNRIVIAGFSMGGQTAIRLGLGGTMPAQHFIGVGPWMGPDLDSYLPPLIDLAKARGVHGAILIGDQDHGSYDGAVKASEMLNAGGVPCELKVYAGLGHTFPPDFAEALPMLLPD